MPLVRIGIWPTVGSPRWMVLPGPSFRVGRGPESELRLDDPAVSGLHAEISWQDQELLVRDLGSKNGILVNGTATGHAELKPGDSLTVGGFRLRLDFVQAEKAPPVEVEEMFRGRMGEDRDLLNLAQDWVAAAPDEARAQRCLARAWLWAGQPQKAAAAAERASLIGADDPETWTLLARAAEMRGHLDRAAEHWKRVLGRVPGDQEATSALTRVEQKREVYAKVRSLVEAGELRGPLAPREEALLEAGPFRIHFRADRHGNLVLSCHAALAQTADRLKELLGYAPKDVEVCLENGDSHGWQAAFYDGAIHLGIGDRSEMDPNFFYVALAHEYVHLAVDRLSAGHCPAWLSEGLAQYVTQNQTPADRQTLSLALERQALLPLAALEGDFDRLQERPLIDLAYAQSYSLVHLLVHELGWSGVRRLLEQLREEGLAGALAAWGLTLSTLEDRWLKWLS